MSKALIHFTKIKYILLREIFSNICSNVLLQISQSPVSRPALNHFFLTTSNLPIKVVPTVAWSTVIGDPVKVSSLDECGVSEFKWWSP